MKLSVEVHVHDDRNAGTLARILNKVLQVHTLEEAQMLNITRLRQEVSESITVQQGVAVAIRAIGAEVRALREQLAGHPALQAELDEMADALDTNANDLGAAAAEGTAAEDEEVGS